MYRTLIRPTNRSYYLIMVILLGLSVLVSCSNFPIVAQETPTPSGPTPEAEAPNPGFVQAEVIFDVQAPYGTPSDAEIYLDILDDVTGLAINPARFPMEAGEDLHYSLTLPVRVGTVLKYRYSREVDSQAIEYTPQNTQVRYRMVLVNGPVTVTDLVSGWSDMTYGGPTGRIIGTARDASSGDGIPGLLVTAGGLETISAADGSFVIEGLVPGIHNLVAYAMDGAFQPFQQGAMIAENSSTPADLVLTAAKMVTVTFNMTVPPENVIGVPVRIAGNLYQTGNSFADLAGGINTNASRMPQMSINPDGTYSLALVLPAGSDFRYKYTLGDGFWNAELSEEGGFRVRQLIVPESDTTITDQVITWRAGDVKPVSFTVQAPENTPSTDYVSIQFNPYGWTESIPMWSIGPNQWMYVLYNPMHLMGEISYRYCRNDQCGSADNSATSSPELATGKFSQGTEDQSFTDTIEAWAWLSTSQIPTTVNAAEISSRGDDFIAGVEYLAGYHPSWQPRYFISAQNIKSIGANWLFYTPTWSFTSENPLVIEPVPGSDQLWIDALTAINQSSAAGLNVAIFPTPSFPTAPSDWWTEGDRDFGWWEVWFNRYHEFLMHHAELATQSGAQALVLGGDWLSPALPGGTLSDGSPSGVPADAELRWRSILTDLRSVYGGQMIWALSYPTDVENPPAFLDDVDGIYVLVSSQLADQADVAEIDLETSIGTILDTGLKPLQETFNKPFYLGISYASANGGAMGCIPLNSGTCLDATRLSEPGSDLASIDLDLQEQVDIYNAIFAQVNQRDWIDGLVSRGYYPPAALQDKTVSINGKPAQDVVWYWFPRLTGQTEP